jgi:tetratricopeptide (TPR) repeat protein
VRGDSLRSIANSEKSFSAAAKIEDIDIMAPAALSLCYAYVSACNYDKLIKMTETVTELIQKTEREADFFNTPFNLHAFFLGLCGMAKGMYGDFRNGKTAADKGLRHAMAVGHPLTLAFNELQCANLLVLKGNGKEAIEHCQNSIKHAEETQWPTILSQGWTILGYANYLIGELQIGQNFVLKGMGIQEESGIEAMLAMHYYIYAMVLLELGDFEESLRYAEKALDLSKRNNEIRYEGLSKIWIGRILGSENKAQYYRGEHSILQGLKILKRLRLKPAIAQGHFILGELYTHSGKQSKARKSLRKASEMFKEMKMTNWLAKSKEALASLMV